MQTLIFGYEINSLILAAFIGVVGIVFIFFILGISCLVIAASHGDIEKLPSNRQFNIFNVLLYPKSLDPKGLRYHKLGLRFLGAWLAIIIFVFVLAGLVKLAT
jgi:hypothetical protein